MKDYPFEVPLQVRYSDIDSYGHVNNAVYVTYFEEARVGFFRDLFEVSGATGFEFIVARLEIDYRRPLRLFEPLRAGLRVDAIGTTSFTFGYQLMTGDEVVATGRTVQVCFDYEQQRKMAVPEAFRRRLEPYRLS